VGVLEKAGVNSVVFVVNIVVDCGHNVEIGGSFLGA